MLYAAIARHGVASVCQPTAISIRPEVVIMSESKQPDHTPHPAPRRHRITSRGQMSVPENTRRAGRFGRMFENLPSFAPDDTTIAKFVARMGEGDNADGDALDNDAIPAGYTYFGQFVDHDLTFDPASDLQRQNDPAALASFRTPVLDLDSVYGLGPDDQPYLIDTADPAKLRIGQGLGQGEPDLPRLGNTAVIGDPRNDENVLVGQIHLAFMQLHNRFVDAIREGTHGVREAIWIHYERLPADKRDRAVYREAQRLTRWHYQWAVLFDFLPRICGPETIERYLQADGEGHRIAELELLDPKEGFIPVEWSVAAYRFGHSMVRPAYHLNPAIRDHTVFPNPLAETDRHLAGGRPLPNQFTLDWRLFLNQHDSDLDPQPSRLIDTQLAPTLSHLPRDESEPDFMAVLAERNLRRGAALGLPSGQAVARRLRLQPLTNAELGVTDAGPDAPLWFYILREAEQSTGGAHLGPVGATIVAETILTFAAGDPFCYLNVDPTWAPILDTAVESLGDIIRWAVPNDGRRFPPAADPSPGWRA